MQRSSTLLRASNKLIACLAISKPSILRSFDLGPSSTTSQVSKYTKNNL